MMTLHHFSTPQRFTTGLKGEIKQLDALVNNAGFAFKNSDPTSHAEQAEPTLNINYYGTTRITEVFQLLNFRGEGYNNTLLALTLLLHRHCYLFSRPVIQVQLSMWPAALDGTCNME